MTLAKATDPQDRAKLRKEADEAWNAATQKNNRPHRSTYKEKAAAIDTAVAEIIDHLADDYAQRHGKRLPKTAHGSARPVAEGPNAAAEDVGQSPRAASPIRSHQPAVKPSPTAPDPRAELHHGGGHDGPPPPPSSRVDEIERLGKALTDVVLKDVEKAYPGPLPDSTKVALADHFWCDLLAQFAHLIDEGVKAVDGIPDRATNLILASRKAHRRLPLEEIVVKTAVKSMWNLLQPLAPPLAALNGFKKLLPVVRVLAVLICKSPERHEAVVTYCVDPLTKSLTDAVKKRLLKTLSGWLPGLADEEGPAAA
ncbi:hypothetical protein [Amycolatopsis sp. DSM 110486]|uniref:hypothetical protein n=1 Tax=Amycolatopsis sp. DSM 110486 TaxID=2865832 RepID=UPI001C6A0BD9|nr:hypothetical protein [Amycolatopsis sp. DSM 110486]QYN25605.1 hypothetical protein K1T34_26205 [Amycolatopsis sp. DSM 110486]